MFASILTVWLVIGALPMGGVASTALGWALPLIAAVMLLLLALLAADTALARQSRSWTGRGRARLDKTRRPAAFHSAGRTCTTAA